MKCNYLGVTIDNYLCFQREVKKVVKKMAAGIKTIETVQHKFTSIIA